MAEKFVSYVITPNTTPEKNANNILDKLIGFKEVRRRLRSKKQDTISTNIRRVADFLSRETNAEFGSHSSPEEYASQLKYGRTRAISVLEVQEGKNHKIIGASVADTTDPWNQYLPEITFPDITLVLPNNQEVNLKDQVLVPSPFGSEDEDLRSSLYATRTAYISDTIISPNRRGQGLSTMLLQAMDTALQEQEMLFTARHARGQKENDHAKVLKRNYGDRILFDEPSNDSLKRHAMLISLYPVRRNQ